MSTYEFQVVAMRIASLPPYPYSRWACHYWIAQAERNIHAEVVGDLGRNPQYPTHYARVSAELGYDPLEESP